MTHSIGDLMKIALMSSADGGTTWTPVTNPSAGGGGGGVSDHGALTGLADDDHPQYHDDVRGDLRYAMLVHNHDGSYALLTHNHDGTYIKTTDQVTTAQIGDLQVTNAKLANNAVQASQIANNAVGTSELLDDAVTNVEAANMPANTIKGNNTGAAADPKDLTVAEVQAMGIGSGGGAAPMRLGPVGRWVPAADAVRGGANSLGPGTLRMNRIYMDVPFDGVACQTGGTAPGAGSTMLVGVYDCNADGTPKNLVQSCSIDIATTTGIKIASITRVPAGLYWFASVPSASCTFTVHDSSGAHPNMPSTGSTPGYNVPAWYISSSTLPNPFSGGVGDSGDVALLYVRIAA